MTKAIRNPGTNVTERIFCVLVLESVEIELLLSPVHFQFIAALRRKKTKTLNVVRTKYLMLMIKR